MRKINTEDAFKTSRLLKYSNIKNTLLDCYEKANSLKKAKDKDIEKFGVSVALELIECLGEHRAEQEFYDLIGGICEKSADEIRTQELATTIEDIKMIIKENDMKSFFKLVSAMV